jgi:hypothetical protein
MPEPSVLGDEDSSQQEAEKPPDSRDHTSEIFLFSRLRTISSEQKAVRQ